METSPALTDSLATTLFPRLQALTNIFPTLKQLIAHAPGPTVRYGR